MPSGFRLDTDVWLKDYENAKQLAQEIVQIVQDRNLNHRDGGPEASRLTALARRRTGTLGTEIERLFAALDAPANSDLSEQEKLRRFDLVHALRNRREQILQSLKRSQNNSDRDTLLGGTSARGRPQETEATAELDARGLLQLQDNVMRQQDAELEHMEKTVVSTKHIALTIGEEVTLHTRLLEELDDDVDVTQSRLRAATQRVRLILRQSSNWKLGCTIFVLIVSLVLVLMIAFKLIKFFK